MSQVTLRRLELSLELSNRNDTEESIKVNAMKGFLTFEIAIGNSKHLNSFLNTFRNPHQLTNTANR